MVLRTSPARIAAGKRRTTIATLTWTTTRLGLEISKGVSDFCRERGWTVMHFDNQLLVDASVLSGSGVSGLVVQAFAQFPVAELLAMGLPAINVSNAHASTAWPRVTPDDPAIGRLAAEYFLSKGFSYFAFCGDSQSRSSFLRGEEFAGIVRKAGQPVAMIEGRFDLPVAYQSGTTLAPLTRWLDELKKPSAIFAWNDAVCDTIINICRNEGWLVPEQISVLGVNNDFNRLVDSEDYSLSSIELAGHAIGYHAAAALAKLMQGEAPAAPLYIAPLRIVERRSTDFYAVTDPALLAALRFIKRNCQRSIEVEEIAKAAMLSRRVLEKRFRLTLHSSPYEEVLRARLDRARELLLNTGLKIEEIAQLCGYDNGSNFSIFFSEKVGSSPKAFRRRLLPAR